LDNKKSTIPFNTWELYISPGWTLADKKTVGLSNLYDLFKLNIFDSSEPSSIAGKIPSASILSSLYFELWLLPVIVISSRYLSSLEYPRSSLWK
jgi:hypothetical protein